MALLSTLVVLLALSASAMLVYFLLGVITALRSITAKLANARLLLMTVAEQTDPATELVTGIGANVATLEELVAGVARTLGVTAGGRR